MPRYQTQIFDKIERIALLAVLAWLYYSSYFMPYHCHDLLLTIANTVKYKQSLVRRIILNYLLHDIFIFISSGSSRIVSIGNTDERRTRRPRHNMRGEVTGRLRAGVNAGTLKYSQASLVHVPGSHCLLYPGCVVCWKSSPPWIRPLPATIVTAILIQCKDDAFSQQEKCFSFFFLSLRHSAEDQEDEAFIRIFCC